MLAEIRAYLKKAKLDAILIARSDSFLGEYFPPYSNRLALTTGGFSGSAGMALITKDESVLFVDSRYTLQAKTQTDFTVLEVPTETTLSDWMKTHLKDAVIGINPWTHSVNWLFKLDSVLKPLGNRFQPMPDKIWTTWFGPDSFVQEDIFDYGVEFAGVPTSEKLKRVADILKEKKLDAFIVTAPENVSWLLNKRAGTVGEYPVVFERGIVFADGTYQIWDNTAPDDLADLKVGIDLSQTPYALYTQILNRLTVTDESDPINVLKAVKSPVEQENIRAACLSESKTICRFLAWIEQNRDTVDELGCADKLHALRAEDSLYFADSFDVIAAAGPHAAAAHYQADAESNVRVVDFPMLLVDTGGHYLNGTTDMTRTICTGEATPLMKKRYTQVLKGHIALALATIAPKESTKKLDELAHSFLRADGVDFLHATGHGIGMMLAVHEYPPIIHEKDTFGLLPGMLFSNEPAYYSESEGFGIRLENMLLSVSDGQNLKLENLFFAPFDYRLVDFALLSQSDKEWLRAYHQRIVDDVFPGLPETDRVVLTPFVTAFGAKVS